MPRITWDSAGERYYESGVDRGVLFASGFDGVAWNGLIGVTENPSGGTSESYYVDGVKYISLSTYEEFAATIDAFTYPDEFNECEGIQEVNVGLYATAQPRKSFSLAYRTMISNDLQSDDYKLHLIYNATVAPTQRGNKSLSESVSPMSFSWAITTTPIAVSGRRNTAHLVIDSRYMNSDALSAIEDIIYGTDTTSPKMPTVNELNTIINEHVTVLVIDHGDGSYTVSGPDANVYLPGSESWVLWFAGNENGFDGTGYAIMPPAGYTSRITNGDQSSYATGMLADNQSAASGATGDQTGTTATNTYWAGVMVALNGDGLSYRATPEVGMYGTDVTSADIPKQYGTRAGDWIYIYLFGSNSLIVACDGFDVIMDTGGLGALLYRKADGTEGSTFTVTGFDGKNVTAIIATVSGVGDAPVIGSIVSSSSAAEALAVPSITVNPTDPGVFVVDWASAVVIDTDTFMVSSL